MSCGPRCACDPGVRCPSLDGRFIGWCESGDPVKRAHVRAMSGSAAPARPTPISLPNGTNPHAGRHLLILGCDYRGGRLDDCGCDRKHWCGLQKGSWADEPFAVRYADCLACVTGLH